MGGGRWAGNRAASRVGFWGTGVMERKAGILGGWGVGTGRSDLQELVVGGPLAGRPVLHRNRNRSSSSSGSSLRLLLLLFILRLFRRDFRRLGWLRHRRGGGDHRLSVVALDSSDDGSGRRRGGFRGLGVRALLRSLAGPRLGSGRGFIANRLCTNGNSESLVLALPGNVRVGRGRRAAPRRLLAGAEVQVL
jgi:hypothetical protein